ncbi:MAG: efflux RND transporter periplasmic adaptor subunit [Pirellulales bacterium]
MTSHPHSDSARPAVSASHGRWAGWYARWRQVLPLLAVGLILFAGYSLGHLFNPDHGSTEHTPAEHGAHGSASPTEVTLTQEKFNAGGLHVTEVAEHPIQVTKTLPGTLEYDATRRLEVRSPADCVVEEVLVERGALVEAGTVLAHLTSLDVGKARNEVQQQESAVRLAQLKLEWATTTDENLESLIEKLRGAPTLAEVNQQFRGALLGTHRDQLLAAYAQYQLAMTAGERSQTLGSDGILSGRAVEQRASDREVAAAAFDSLCEESRFQSKQELEQARSALVAAQQSLQVGREQLTALLGPYGETTEGTQRTEFRLVAPQSGRVDQLMAVTAGRFKQGEPILSLADVRHLWLSVQVHQQDWGILESATGRELLMRVPAVPNRQWQAQTRFVGSSVGGNSLSVPLVADVDNSDELLRPGMFAWAEVPTEGPRNGITVATGAIQRHEGETFVFIETSPLHYRRVGVQEGHSTPEWTEVTQGLQPGQRVVDQGAFFLKSELLLEEE